MSSPSDVIEISSDSDDDVHPPPASSQFTSPQKHFNHDLTDLCGSSDDEELPAPGDPKFFRGVGLQAKRERRSSTPSDHGYDVYSDEATDEDESLSEVSQSESDAFAGEIQRPKIARKESAVSGSKAPRKPRKTGEQKAEERAAAKALKAQESAEKKSQKAREKEEKKQYMAANKLVSDKKKTLKDMQIIFPPSLADSDLHRAFVAEVAQYDMAVAVADRNLVRRYSVFSWRRAVDKEYSEVAREWLPVAPYIRTEDMYMIYMSANDLAHCIKYEDGVKNVVRQVQAICPGQIFLMVYGLTAYLECTTVRIRYTMPQIERAVAALQMAEHTHLLYVDTVQEAVTRLYDLSADLGIKPYKLIKRAHLQLCANIELESGKGLADTWVKMLAQVHKLTAYGALGIADVYPTARSLVEAYEDSQTAQAREQLLADCMVTHRVDGARKPRPLGKALSKRVGTVMYGTDPSQPAYKDT